VPLAVEVKLRRCKGLGQFPLSGMFVCGNRVSRTDQSEKALVGTGKGNSFPTGAARLGQASIPREGSGGGVVTLTKGILGIRRPFLRSKAFDVGPDPEKAGEMVRAGWDLIVAGSRLA
jgi:hypothetical protein